MVERLDFDTPVSPNSLKLAKLGLSRTKHRKVADGGGGDRKMVRGEKQS